MQGKANQCAESQAYVGIDVSKGHLDVYLHPLGESMRVANNKSGWRQLKRRLGSLDVCLIVVEATGKYHRGVHRSLADGGYPVAAVNPYRSRCFGNALGELAKTDKIDARMLALAGEALKLAATPLPSEALLAWQELANTITALKAERTAHRNRLAECVDAIVKRQLASLLKSLEKHIACLEKEVMARLKADPMAWRRYQILTSIPGIGPIVAMTMIVHLAELGSCTSKQIAALIGVAPMNCDSGLMRGKARIKGGRAQVRTPLYMAAVTASRCAKSDLKDFYERLRQNGKSAKLALTAVMRKLTVLANTLIKENRHWQPVCP